MGGGKEVPFSRNAKVFLMVGQVDEIEPILVLSCTAISKVKDPKQIWIFAAKQRNQFLQKSEYYWSCVLGAI